MAVTDEQIAFVRDLFRDVPGVTTRKMFGGLGIYSEGTIFALIGPGDAIMVKARGDLADQLAAEGAEQWTTYEGKTVNMPYWILPDAALDDPDEACRWARLSIEQNAS
ncbi:TfoX/Sxy family protein [Marivita hallyeonensis]|uniref:DNA transformation protein n=1 Tax=Marivita hallyeonensis TaxID=996342 RepID=A0A1M5RDN3_9RHOB|nr:TfoX/Sxy family protein [Marivita hallyeonensis]SHH24308.1 DNA transformation protein [Marivita hallyeonensis]